MRNFRLPAHAQGVYRFGPGELELADLTAWTRATQVHASGTLSSSAALKLSVTTTNLGEWQPVFTAAGYAGQIPVTLKGHASFNGTATGKISQIAIAGNLQSQDFETLIPATSHTPEKLVNWNALQADMQLSPSVFAVRNGVLSRDPDSLKFDFRAQLDHRQFTDDSPFAGPPGYAECRFARHSCPGRICIPGHRDGGPAYASGGNPVRARRGKATFRLRDGSIYGEPVERFSADLNFNGEEAELTNIQLAHYDSTVTGERQLFNPSSQAFRFNLKGDNFDLTRISDAAKRSHRRDRPRGFYRGGLGHRGRSPR